MDLEKWCLRVGAAAVICAVLLRLGSNGALETAAQALTSQEALSVMLYLETGRILRPAQPQLPEETAPADPEPDLQQATAPSVPEQVLSQPVFSPEDAQLVSVTNYPGYSGTVHANVIVYRNRVIGGDVCSADVGGFIHGFEK